MNEIIDYINKEIERIEKHYKNSKKRIRKNIEVNYPYSKIENYDGELCHRCDKKANLWEETNVEYPEYDPICSDCATERVFYEETFMDCDILKLRVLKDLKRKFSNSVNKEAVNE